MSSKRYHLHFIQLIIIIVFIGKKEEHKNDQKIGEDFLFFLKSLHYYI